MNDPLFQVEVISSTPNPQTAVWAGMHQDYSSGFVFEDKANWPSEEEAGKIAVKRLLRGERGHYGPLEHAQIQFATGYFPHSVMQQARTHRIGVSFDVQSMRYTSEHIIKAADGEIDIERAFYLRPTGDYTDRQGKKYNYSDSMRGADRISRRCVAIEYAKNIELGMAEEHARGGLPFDYRQHFVVSFTLRALLHFLDLRAKMDAQEEIRILCEMMWPHLEAWAPEIAAWYHTNRYGKARLAP
jgi:thymidylate synthase (FAD)